MLILNPRHVTLGSDILEDVSAIVIDRTGARTIVEWSDSGPHAVFVDVPEQRISIRIVQDIAQGDVGAPRPGESHELVFSTAPNASDVGRRRVTATVVISAVSHELSRRRGAVRTIDCIAVSADGQADPITIEDAQGAQA